MVRKGRLALVGWPTIVCMVWMGSGFVAASLRLRLVGVATCTQCTKSGASAYLWWLWKWRGWYGGIRQGGGPGPGLISWEVRHGVYG